MNIEPGAGKSKNNLPVKDSPDKKEIKKEMLVPDKPKQSVPNKKDSVKK
jgi:hypothetical protein